MTQPAGDPTIIEFPEITRLKGENEALKLANTLATLAAAAQQQANITSLNPAIANNIYFPLTLNWQIIAYMYKTHGILQTAIDMPVMDALRGGLDLKSEELDADDLKELTEDLDEFGILSVVQDAVIWKRLFGGGALIINTDQDPSTPLDETRIQKLRFYAATRWELGTQSGPLTGEVPMYQNVNANSEYFQFYNQKIHKSRVITLIGKRAPFTIRWQLQGWGMSEYERMMAEFNTYLKTNDVVYELLKEAKLDVYKFIGFKSLLMTQTGSDIVQDRLALMNKIKNFENAIAMDKDDEFEQKQITFSGLAEMKKQNMIGIAAALRMPMAKIFGLSAAGFNSGEDDIENYNAMVESEVRSELKRPLKRVLKLMVAAKKGLPESDISFDFKPLRMLGAVEEESVKTSKQNRIIQLYDRGLANAVETAEEIGAEELFSKQLETATGAEPAPPQIEHEQPEPEGGNPREK